MFFRKLLAVGLLLIASPAAATTVVTACGTDKAAGGVNLATALALGEDITIQCSGGAGQIVFTQPWTVMNATTIDGGGVTFVGTGSGVMFNLTSAAPLTLRHLNIRNPPTTPSAFTGVVYDASDTADVELDTVTVSDTRLPFAVHRFVASHSTFTGNGDAAYPDVGVVMAAQLNLKQDTFQNNLSRPFHSLWRGDPIASGEAISAQVVRSVFVNNRRPSEWAVGNLVVEGSRFEGNGDSTPFPPMKAGSLYGGTIYLELNPSAAGALEIVLGSATISRTTFKGNHGMLGGAVLASRSSLTLQSSELDDNQAISGGAVAFLSPPGSGLQGGPPLTLTLGHVKLHGNVATRNGGGFLLLGAVTGDAVLLSGNKATLSGGAIAFAGPAIAPGDGLPAPTAANLPAVGPASGSLVLSRLFVLDSVSGGDAISGQNANLRIGDMLATRNTAGPSGGAVIRAATVALDNGTVLGNAAQGIAVITGVRLSNTIIADNQKGNCDGPQALIVDGGGNLQNPDRSCGSTIAIGAPSLDSRFSPTLGSPARTGGLHAVCVSSDVVDGVDIYGLVRGAATCSIGAVEADFQRDVIAHLPFGLGSDWQRFLIFVVVFLLICILCGLVLGLLRRRHRKRRARVSPREVTPPR